MTAHLFRVLTLPAVAIGLALTACQSAPLPPPAPSPTAVAVAATATPAREAIRPAAPSPVVAAPRAAGSPSPSPVVRAATSPAAATVTPAPAVATPTATTPAASSPTATSRPAATPTAAARPPAATPGPTRAALGNGVASRRRPLAIPTARSFPIERESKLGLGVYSSGGHIMEALRQAEPGVILIQEPKLEFARELRRNFPRAFIVGKRFQVNGQPLDNPRARGEWYAEFVAELAVPLRGVVDAWQSYNEPIGGGDPSLYAAYNEFQVAFAERLQGVHGISAVAGNDPAGAFQPEDYPTYFANAIRASDYLGIHAYSSGEKPYRLNEPAADWYILRYRKIHDALEAAGITGVQMIVTESGHGQGWVHRIGSEELIEDFYWLTAEVEKDPYVVGHAIFGLFGDGNWPEFDLPIVILERFRAYGYLPPEPLPEELLPDEPEEHSRVGSWSVAALRRSR